MADYPIPARPKRPGKVTPSDVRRWPHYYLTGLGRPAARLSLCPHRRALTDTCDLCP